MCTFSSRVPLSHTLPIFCGCCCCGVQAGLNRFPESTYILAHYSLFLNKYGGSKELNRASAMLVSIADLKPLLDLRFLLFSSSRSLEQARQGENLGRSEIDIIGVLAFRRNHNQALTRHSEAVSAMHRLWKAIDKAKDVSGGVLWVFGGDPLLCASFTASAATEPVRHHR